MRLPEEFTSRMAELLQEEWPQLLEAWKGLPHQGLRVNTLKISIEDFLSQISFQLETIPWTEDGFYYQQGERPAKHPYYQAGLYYLQEPSAMAPVTCLDVQPGERVLDLCAAPGGKSTQIASLLAGRGLLVSNDNSSDRVKALARNLERWGATNAMVTNEVPEGLSRYFPQFFDKILIDAPCSGEGMFRKDLKAVKSWTSYNTETCAVMQKDILWEAAKMLKPGGRFLYSTCTFAPEENEGIIGRFLEEHPNFSLLPLPAEYGWAPGRPQWLNLDLQLAQTRRLWPHKVRGEGHFLALLQKEKDCELTHQYSPGKRNDKVDDKVLAPFQEFMAENLATTLKGPFLLQGQFLYQIHPELGSLPGLRTVRQGWFLGTIKNRRFEPSQALAMGLRKEMAQRTISLTIEDELLERYLKGETLLVEGEKGWTLVCLEDFPLGWAKQTGEHLKNYYPPGWRLME